MIKAFLATEKTNSYTPTPWHWGEDPFPAFRGHGQRYNAFLAVAKGFKPWFSSLNLSDNTAMSDDFSKIIVTKKGTRLLVPCSKKEDERIVLITARGSFRGGFNELQAVGGDILWSNGSSMHCAPVQHIIARITSPDGYVMTETGDCNRSATGLVEIFSWKGGYFRMPTAEYEAAVESGQLFAAHDTIQSDLQRCRDRRAEQAASRRIRADLLPRLEQVNQRLKACEAGVYQLGDTFFTIETSSGSHVYLYTEANVKRAEDEVEFTEEKYANRLVRDQFLPLFYEASRGFSFCKSSGEIEYFATSVSVRYGSTYKYSEEGLAQFKADLPKYEEKHQQALAEAEAKRRQKEQEEADRRLMAEHRQANQARIDEILDNTDLPRELRFLFEDSEGTKSEIEAEVAAILKSSALNKSDETIHELVFCGFDRRCQAIDRVLRYTGGGELQLNLGGQAGSKRLANFLADGRL